MLSPRLKVAPVILLVGILAGADFAQGPPTETAVLAKAEAAFLQGTKAADNPAEARPAFARAAALFDELCRRGIRNPHLYRNLGNAEFLAGRPAHAIRAFHQGLRWAPHDGVLRANLEYVRAGVHYPATVPPPAYSWPAGLPLPSPVFLQFLTLGLFTLFCGFGTHWLITGCGHWPTMILALGTFLAGGGFLWIHWQSLQEDRFPLVVIANDGTPLFRGNGESYPRHPDLPSVQEGMEARRLVERGDWLQIQFLGGAVGWVRRHAVLLDEPAAWAKP